ncbi:MAG: radical SAM protein [Bacteroidetes bacterium]|nr:MAG: radical SAM protein [Bacteroidota bacterium]
MKSRATIPLFIPEIACPHRCVFCNQYAITGNIQAPSPEQIRQTITHYLKTLSGVPFVEVAFFGGSFTGIPIEQQQQYLDLEMLKKAGVVTIELGAQSLHEEVLLHSGRGHSVQAVEQASQMIVAHGFQLGLQMMVGLPGDTPERSKHTAKRIIALGATNTRIYPTLVVKETALARKWKEGSYQALSVEEALSYSITPYLLLEEANVEIIRVGLHPSEGFLRGDELLAGPFHVAFRELLMTAIWHRIYLPLCTGTPKKRAITLCVPRDELPYAVGHGSRNKKRLLQSFCYVNYIPMERITISPHPKRCSRLLHKA